MGSVLAKERLENILYLHCTCMMQYNVSVQVPQTRYVLLDVIITTELTASADYCADYYSSSSRSISAYMIYMSNTTIVLGVL